ncbi:MAG: hypothetical protein GX257_09710 [Clostridiales bacterium]|jgi:putative aldouronate transport system substrate-binding protein|nr:hypothetical protein [Clostridiales bacterium]
MSRNKLRIISLALALLMSVLLLQGCSSTEKEPDTDITPDVSKPTQAPKESEPSDEQPSPSDEVTYPLAEGATFKCWWPNDLVLSGVEDYNETPFFQYMEKKTGVHLEFSNPPAQGAVEQYNLILVSGDLPDFFRQLYIYHVRGLDDAVDDQWILDMMNYKHWTPNLMSRLEADEEAYIQAITDSGYLVGFPMVMDEAQQWVNGMMIRGDWLDKYNLKKPETLAEVEHVLTVFRDNEESASRGPLYMNNMIFTGLEGTFNMPSNFDLPAIDGFIYRDGAVRASALEQGYKDYILTMADWYDKGLIHPDFVNNVGYISIFDREGRQNGKYGITYDCFVYLDDENELVGGDFRFEPLAMPVVNKGDTVHVLGSDKLVWQGALGITTACENIELACRYWDYLYSDEGSLYANYGELGVTLEYDENGNPHLSDFAKNHPEMNLNQVENYYTLLDGPFYRHMMREFEAISENELKCGDEWTKGDGLYNLPSNLTFTAEEGTRKANIMSDLQVFVAENQIKLVTGVKPISELDAFIDQIKEMGIYEVIEMYEAALERYNNRKNLINN